MLGGRRRQSLASSRLEEPQLVTTPSSGVRLSGVEGLRALAATSIVVVHVWGFGAGHALGSGRIAYAFSTLAVGVTLFFTLSGFLLYRPFAASIARGKPHMPIRAYLRNRALRIAPAYWVILVITALVFAAAGTRDAAGNLGLGRLTDPLAFLQAGFLLQDYRPSTMVVGIGPAWSLAVEVVFYCVLPLLVLGALWVSRFARDRSGRVLVLLGPPLLLLLVGLSGKHATHLLPGSPLAGYNTDWHSVIERSFWAQADLFTFGMAVAVLYTEVVDGRIVLPRYWRWFTVGLGLLVFLPCAWTMHEGEQSYLPQNTGEALGIGLIFAAVIIPDLSAGQPRRAVRLLETRPLVAAGVVSYSLFLWHLPVILWLQHRGLTFGGWTGLPINLVIVGVIAGGLSALTYRFVELPALKRKLSTRTPERPAPASVTAAPEPTEVLVAGPDPAIPQS
jgi:peptidoglycan/LPS O-acetylase OafA/YrhL